MLTQGQRDLRSSSSLSGTEPDTVPPSENHDSADSPIPGGELTVAGGSYSHSRGLWADSREEVKI